MAEKHKVKKNKTLKIEYDFIVKDYLSRYNSSVLVKTLEDFDMMEQRRKSGLSGRRFIEYLVNEKLIKYINYTQTGIGGIGNCEIKEVSDK